METKQTEVWAVAYAQAVKFFATQPDVTAAEGGFRCGSCRIRITQLPERSVGSLRFPQTELALEGGAEDAERIYRRFYYTFLSAGG